MNWAGSKNFYNPPIAFLTHHPLTPRSDPKSESIQFSTATTFAGTPLRSVQVTLRGQVYHVHQVSTVRELQEQLEEESGLDVYEQGRVTFQGKVLPHEATSLVDFGLKDGDQINMVPQQMADQWAMMRDFGNGLISLRNKVHLQGPFATPEEHQQVQIMSNLYEDLIKTPFIPEDMERFSRAIQDPVAVERSKDPEWIESMRQVILNNPLLLKHMTESSRSKQALQSREEWYQYIVDSIDSWGTMTSYELWKRLSEGRLFGGKE